MFLKDQEPERQTGLTDDAAEECRELSDEQLDAVAGGGAPPFDLTSNTCALCGTEQPNGWTSDECYACGASLGARPL